MSGGSGRRRPFFWKPHGECAGGNFAVTCSSLSRSGITDGSGVLVTVTQRVRAVLAGGAASGQIRHVMARRNGRGLSHAADAAITTGNFLWLAWRALPRPVLGIDPEQRDPPPARPARSRHGRPVPQRGSRERVDERTPVLS